MSHFEYVSVAIALIYALVVGRLLSGLTPSMDEGRRYLVQIGWIVILLLVCVLQWWIVWRTKPVDWSPLRFLWVLTSPALLFVRTGALVGADPSAVTSYRTHFYEKRVVFFALGIASAFVAGLTPWILGLIPWFSLAPIHPTTLTLAGLSLAGMVLRNERAQVALVLLTGALVIISFYLPEPGSAP